MTDLAFRFRAPADARDWARARRLVEDYVAALELDLSFQHLTQELASLDRQYGPPGGAFIVAEVVTPQHAQEDPMFVGCVGLRPFDSRVGEIKRLYVAPDLRGRGLGRMLINRVLSEALELGYERLVLDSLPSMAAARALYESVGFFEISPYRFNPVAGTTYFERRLP